MNKQKLFIHGLIGFALYLISTGLAFASFTFYSQTTGNKKGVVTPIVRDTQGNVVVDESVPKTEECPLNGKFYTKSEKEIWEKRRPLAVMIENHEESRPQSGLSSADIVYETVAEGGITRFMGVFYCGIANPVQLAPIRSARTYFLPWVLEYDALYNHVGGAGRCNDDTVDERAKALCQIGEYKIKDMDQFGISFPTCFRNYDRLDRPVATEHTMVCLTDKLFKVADERGWTDVDAKGTRWDKNFVQWKYKDDADAAQRGASFSASFVSWKGYEAQYGVRWVYDPSVNTYKRFNGGSAHIDLETKKQLEAKVVLIQFAKETGPVDDHAHLLYANIGSGDGLLFQDGKKVEVIWKKKDKNARTVFFDTKGKEVDFNRGQMWVEMLPVGTSVTY